MDQAKTNLQESDQAQTVTIPYFLYEAMARSYYGNERNADVPVESPERTKQEPSKMKDMFFNPSDVPPSWKPGGVAARKVINESSEVRSAEEEN